MRVLCTSDLHGMWSFDSMPEADVLVVAGDFTAHGRLDEIGQFNDYLQYYPVPHKIVIAGNHDWAFQDKRSAEQARRLLTNAIYLQDESVSIDGVKFYGSPWTPKFFDWAFMLPRGQLYEKWNKIPTDTDVLITHGPPAGKCDRSPRRGEYVGCEELRDAVLRVRPKLHIFGHIHGAWGQAFNEHTGFINAARCNESYDPVQDPILVEL